MPFTQAVQSQSLLPHRVTVKLTFCADGEAVHCAYHHQKEGAIITQDHCYEQIVLRKQGMISEYWPKVMVEPKRMHLEDQDRLFLIVRNKYICQAFRCCRTLWSSCHRCGKLGSRLHHFQIKNSSSIFRKKQQTRLHVENKMPGRTAPGQVFSAACSFSTCAVCRDLSTNDQCYAMSPDG